MAQQEHPDDLCDRGAGRVPEPCRVGFSHAGCDRLQRNPERLQPVLDPLPNRCIGGRARPESEQQVHQLRFAIKERELPFEYRHQAFAHGNLADLSSLRDQHALQEPIEQGGL